MRFLRNDYENSKKIYQNFKRFVEKNFRETKDLKEIVGKLKKFCEEVSRKIRKIL